MQVGFHPYIELSTFIISGKCGYWCLKHLTKTPFFSLPSKRKYFIRINQDCEAFEEKLNHCGKYQHGKPPNCPDCHLPLQEGSRNESTAGQSIDRIYHCYFFLIFEATDDSGVFIQSLGLFLKHLHVTMFGILLFQWTSCFFALSQKEVNNLHSDFFGIESWSSWLELHWTANNYKSTNRL